MQDKEQERKYRRYRRISRLVLTALSLLMLFLGYRATKLQFDYDFEKFFPQEDADLVFYQEYRNTFENDNDFILIGVENYEGIFQQSFLKQVELFTEELRTLPHLREVISPLEMKYFELGSMGIGFNQKAYFHPDAPELYREDSLRLTAIQEPIAEMVSIPNNSIILVIKNIQFPSKEESDELATELQALVNSQPFDEVHTLGKIMGQKTYIEVLKVEFLTFMLISIFVLIVFLIVAYRSAWGVLIPLATVLLAVIGSLGFMELSGTPLNMMTTLLPVIMLVVGMSDVIHLVSKYLEEIRMKRDKLTAIRNMLKKVGVATLLTSLTTALGFITLIGVNMEPIQDFGVFTAVGVLLAFVLSILFIPAIFMLIKTPKIVNDERLQNGWERGLGKLFLILSRNRKKVLIIYGLLTVVLLLGASRIQFDYYLMQDLDEHQPLMKDLRFFQKQFGGIRPFEMAIIPQKEYKVSDFEVMKELEKVTSYLDSTYGVNQLVSPALPYKYLNKILRNGKSDYYKIPKSEKRYTFLKEKIEPFKEKMVDHQLFSETEKIGRINGRMVDPGSRTMLERNELLRNFIAEQVDTSIVQFKLTGTPAIIDESGRYVSRNIVIGLLIAFAIIALSMGVLFKSIKVALISLVPNIFPILLTAGFIGFAGIDLNMSTAIVFTIAFGIAVDDTIHFLSRYRQEMRMGSSNLIGLRRTFISTGKAIIITTIILLGGFGSLVFSDFLSTFYIGLFVCMTLISAVITDLTLLPMLLLAGKKRKKN